MPDDPALTVMLKKTNLNKLDTGATKTIFDQLKDYFSNAINTSIAVSCTTLKCGERGDKNSEFPYPYPAPLVPLTQPKDVSTEPAESQTAALGVSPYQAFFASIQESTMPESLGLKAVAVELSSQEVELAEARAQVAGLESLIAQKAPADFPQTAIVGLTMADTPQPAVPEAKSCRAFYGPVKAIGSGKINFTLVLSITYSSVTATLTINADAGMSVETVAVRLLDGPCKPPDCKNETKLEADVLVRYWGNLNITASVAITLPVLGTIAGGATVTKFGLACEEQIQRQATCPATA